MGQDKGFLASLLDTSFSSLITTKIIRALYTIVLVLVSLFSVITLLAILFGDTGGAEKLLGIIVVPLAWLFYVIWTRVGLEVVIALFKIMENTTVVARAAVPAPPPPVTPGEPADGLL